MRFARDPEILRKRESIGTEGAKEPFNEKINRNFTWQRAGEF